MENPPYVGMEFLLLTVQTGELFALQGEDYLKASGCFVLTQKRTMLVEFSAPCK